ncbi:MAG: hypothetical protein KDD43_10020 [Bdellovibrionales bacterium]|nr:hypothetical protein [Bdellovibrionales bacterium]
MAKIELELSPGKAVTGTLARFVRGVRYIGRGAKAVGKSIAHANLSDLGKGIAKVSNKTATAISKSAKTLTEKVTEEVKRQDNSAS